MGGRLNFAFKVNIQEKVRVTVNKTDNLYCMGTWQQSVIKEVKYLECYCREFSPEGVHMLRESGHKP